MAEPYLYTHDDQTSVEVLVDGAWWPAELRMRTQLVDGFHYNVAWTRTGETGSQTHLDTFHQDQVRADQVDRSRGRGEPGPSVDVSTQPT